jgi:tetratricopeptide (TPR) repeat protein
MTNYVGYNSFTMAGSFILKRAYVYLFLMALLGLLAYSNTFKVPFIFDDRPNIVENPIMRDLEYFIDPSRASNFTGYGEYPTLIKRYVGHLSFALNYRAHGLDVKGYHAVNLLIHILNGMLLFWIVQLTFKTPYMEGSSIEGRSRHIAFFAAVVFILHPVQTQAVTYIVQRLTSLATLFYLVSVLAYVKSRFAAKGAKRYALYATSLLSALLAMNTKQIAFTLPLAISLYEFSFFKGAIRKRILFLVPLLLTLFVIPLSFINVDRPIGELMGDMGEATTIRNIPRLDYLLTEFRVMATYLRLLVLPVSQNLDYDYPVYDSFFALPVLLSFLFLVLIIALGIVLFRRSWIKDNSSRLIAFGIFWFFLSISVESSIIPLQVIYEHRIYLPSVGASLAFSSGSFLLYERLKDRKTRAAATALLTALPLVFGIATFQRNSVWKTEIGLWEDVVKKSPHRARPHYNLGKSFQQWGMVWKAMKEYEIAVQLKPDYVKAHNNLGIVYLKVGRMEESIKEYRIAIALDPEFKEAHFNLGIAYLDTGQLKKAQASLKRCLELDPGYARAKKFIEYISRNPARQ